MKENHYKKIHLKELLLYNTDKLSLDQKEKILKILINKKVSHEE